MRGRLLRVPWIGLCPRLQLPRGGVGLAWRVMSHAALGELSPALHSGPAAGLSRSLREDIINSPAGTLR